VRRFCISVRRIPLQGLPFNTFAVLVWKRFVSTFKHFHSTACKGMPTAMNFSLKRLAAASLILASFSAFTLPAQANITPQQSAAILKSFDEASLTDFRQFLGAVGKSDLGKTDNLGPAINAFLDNKTPSAEQQNEIYRLLGIYTRAKYGKAALETLRELVEIPTFQKEGVAQHDNPEFIKIAEKIKNLAESFNLKFRNVDNRVYEISLDGSGDEVVGIHAHADVVPVTPENWVLKDGTKLDPFKVTLIGDRMYGRGTEDDKNGIVVAMYAAAGTQLQTAGGHHRRNHRRRDPVLLRTQPDAELQHGAGRWLPGGHCRERLRHGHGQFPAAQG
jgi:hypothetical protein